MQTADSDHRLSASPCEQNVEICFSLALQKAVLVDLDTIAVVVDTK